MKTPVKLHLSIIVALLFATQCFAAGLQDTVLNRYKLYLLKTEGSAYKADQVLQNFNSSGQWNDINYNYAPDIDMKIRTHLERVRKLALIWANPSSAYYHSNTLWDKIAASLGAWTKKKYQSTSWWNNEIGVPRIMRDIIILTKEQLSPDLLNQSLIVLNQLKVHGTGANLTWSADLGLHYGALTGNTTQMDSCSKLLVNEIVVGTAEGIQPDYSFHQHGNRLQSFHYGLSFLEDNSRLAWELRGTPWKFPDDKVTILVRMILNGEAWMERGSNIAPAIIDRAISRPGALHGGNLNSEINLLADVLPSAADSLQAVSRRYSNAGSQQTTGFKYFPYSDFAAYHNPAFSFFLKTVSVRTSFSETINDENLKGRLLNGGNTYYMRDGNEYNDVMPVWNWDYLPGITNFNAKATVKQTSFNGSVSDGKNGLNGMDYIIQDGDKKLTAHKVWAVHNNMVVCLIGGIQSTNLTENAFTVLNQCRLQGTVELNAAGALVTGDHVYKDVKWIYHSGFAYIPIGNNSVRLKADTASGSWRAISRAESPKQIHDKIFMPVILHNNAASVAYVVAACSNSIEASRLAMAPKWSVLINDINQQAIAFTDNVVMAAFFAKGQITLPRGKLTADRPCLVLINDKQIEVSDPLHLGGTVNITLAQHPYQAVLDKNGGSALIQL